MHLLEPREHPSELMKWLSPVFALSAMLMVGGLLFLILGVPPLQALYIFFIEPLTTTYSLSELVIKASPLILIALGLAVGFRAKPNWILDIATHDHHGGNRWYVMGADSCTIKNSF